MRALLIAATVFAVAFAKEEAKGKAEGGKAEATTAAPGPATTPTISPIAADGTFSVCVSNCAWATVNDKKCDPKLATHKKEEKKPEAKKEEKKEEAKEEKKTRKRRAAAAEATTAPTKVTEQNKKEPALDEDGCQIDEHSMVGICLGGNKMDGMRPGDEIGLTFQKFFFVETKADPIKVTKEMAGKTIKITGFAFTGINWKLVEDPCD